MSVVPARVSTAATAHHDSTGICARKQRVHEALQRRHFELDAGVALHQRDIAERIGGSFGEIGIMPLDRALQRERFAHDEHRQDRERHAQHDQRQGQPPVQDQRSRQQQHDEDEGGEMLAEERQPQPPQRVGAGQHDLHLPAGMRAGMVGERQLQHVLEIIRQHHVAAPMRKPVGEPGNQRAAKIMNRPKPTQAPTSGASARAAGATPAGNVPDSASTMRPNSTGSTNCAAASAILASASVTASRASDRNSAEDA